MIFPNDVDGDVMRRLAENGFNFEDKVRVDFNHWPLSSNEKEAIENLYPNCEFYDPDEEDIENGDFNGYVQFSVFSKVEHEFIASTQKNVSNKMKQFGGWCDSWGVYLE